MAFPVRNVTKWKTGRRFHRTRWEIKRFTSEDHLSINGGWYRSSISNSWTVQRILDFSDEVLKKHNLTMDDVYYVTIGYSVATDLFEGGMLSEDALKTASNKRLVYVSPPRGRKPFYLTIIQSDDESPHRIRFVLSTPCDGRLVL